MIHSFEVVSLRSWKKLLLNHEVEQCFQDEDIAERQEESLKKNEVHIFQYSLLRWTKAPIATFSERRSSMYTWNECYASECQSQRNECRVCKDQILSFWGADDRQRTLVIEIAAITLASDSAITIAPFGQSKVLFRSSCGLQLCQPA